MKIKVFESTAVAVAALVEAAELVLDQRLRIGQHTIEVDSEPQTVKLVIIDGTLLGADPNKPLRIDVGGHIFMVFNETHQRWNLKDSDSVFCLDSKTYRITWDDGVGRPKLIHS